MDIVILIDSALSERYPRAVGCRETVG